MVLFLIELSTRKVEIAVAAAANGDEPVRQEPFDARERTQHGKTSAPMCLQWSLRRGWLDRGETRSRGVIISSQQ
jgi:hypothetical protein